VKLRGRHRAALQVQLDGDRYVIETGTGVGPQRTHRGV
jgi:hypothetical protein